MKYSAFFLDVTYSRDIVFLELGQKPMCFSIKLTSGAVKLAKFLQQRVPLWLFEVFIAPFNASESTIKHETLYISLVIPTCAKKSNTNENISTITGILYWLSNNT